MRRDMAEHLGKTDSDSSISQVLALLSWEPWAGYFIGLYFHLTLCDIREKLDQKVTLRSGPSLNVHGSIWPLE